MMDWTDRHCRFFHRLLTRARAALHRDGDRPARCCTATARGCSASIRRSIRWRCSSAAPTRRDSPQAARIGAEFGYDEINLNVGCPSDRVQSGRFGACLMREPALVADCVAAMRDAVAHPGDGEVPHRRRRPGPRTPLDRFVDPCVAAGVDVFVVHARKAWLKGLSPKENREVPPLDYDRGLSAEARAAGTCRS